MLTYAIIDPGICPACGSDATEWAPFDEEIYEAHDDISGNIAEWGEKGIGYIRVGRRCRACGEGYVVDMCVNFDACRCVDKKRMDPPGSANPLTKPFPKI